MEREHGIIERGKITAVSEDGYSVASIDRYGIETPPLKALEYGQSGGSVPTYSVGETVYYFVFRDGTGRIICAI